MRLVSKGGSQALSLPPPPAPPPPRAEGAGERWLDVNILLSCLVKGGDPKPKSDKVRYPHPHPKEMR